jgi:hypothetical protein
MASIASMRTRRWGGVPWCGEIAPPAHASLSLAGQGRCAAPVVGPAPALPCARHGLPIGVRTSHGRTPTTTEPRDIAIRRDRRDVHRARLIDRRLPGHTRSRTPRTLVARRRTDHRRGRAAAGHRPHAARRDTSDRPRPQMTDEPPGVDASRPRRHRAVGRTTRRRAPRPPSSPARRMWSVLRLPPGPSASSTDEAVQRMAAQYYPFLFYFDGPRPWRAAPAPLRWPLRADHPVDAGE